MQTRMKFNMAILIVILFIFSICLIGQEQTTQEKKETDKRSAIVEVDGYAFLSEDKTIKEMREEAVVNAKREALERAKTHIQSYSKVENFQLSYDIVMSEAEGTIKILESKDHGITDDNRYHYWIQAEVEYSLKPPKGQMKTTKDLIKDINAPLTVHLWTEKSEYKAGEKINIFVQGNKDFYGRVIYRDAQGNLLQLLPNPHRKENFFKGGEVVIIPGKEDRFSLEVGPPFGIENIIVYGSSAPMGEVDVETIGDQLYSVRGSIENFSVKTRGVKIVKEEGKPQDQGVEFFETQCELRTKM